MAGYSYRQLSKWIDSSAFQSYLKVGRNNPALLNELIREGVIAYGYSWGEWIEVALNTVLNGVEGGESAATVAGLFEHFKDHGEWDLKPGIRAEYGSNGNSFLGSATTDSVVRADVFGNVNYGAMMAMSGVSY